MDALATRKHLLAPDEEIERIADFLEGKLVIIPGRADDSTYWVLLIRHGIEGTFLGRHLVCVKTAIVSLPRADAETEQSEPRM